MKIMVTQHGSLIHSLLHLSPVVTDVNIQKIISIADKMLIPVNNPIVPPIRPSWSEKWKKKTLPQSKKQRYFFCRIFLWKLPSWSKPLRLCSPAFVRPPGSPGRGQSGPPGTSGNGPVPWCSWSFSILLGWGCSKSPGCVGCLQHRLCSKSPA